MFICNFNNAVIVHIKSTIQILHHILLMLTLPLSLGTSHNLPPSRELPANKQQMLPL
jgi:hypothetical protein